MFSLEEFRAAAKGRSMTMRAAAPLIERAQQAAVAAEALMADQHWALYQQLIAGSIEQITRQRDILTAALAAPATVNPDEIWRLKGQIAELTGMKVALDLALSLPRALVDDGNKAAADLAAALAEKGVPADAAAES